MDINIGQKSKRAVSRGHWYLGIQFERPAEIRYDHLVKTSASQA